MLAEDELQNVEMAEHEKTKKNNEMKIKKKDYKGYDDDEFVAGNEGQRRAVLAKYDEELEGAKETVSGPQSSQHFDVGLTSMSYYRVSG